MSVTAASLIVKVSSDTKAGVAGIDNVTTKTSKMGKIGNAAGKALAAGLLIAGAAAVSAAQAAAADEAAAAKLANTLHNAAGATDAQVAATEKWISAQGKALGVTDDELRPAIAQLAAATGDVGKAQRLASLAMNISAGTGKDLGTVTKALAAAEDGRVTGLGKFQVETKNAEGKTRSLAAIQKDLAKTYKGAASSAADTVAGKQKRLKVAMGELQEEIGAKLLPIMLKLANVGLKVVDWITKNQTIAVAFIGTVGGLLAVTYAVSKAMQVWKAITTAFTVAQAALNFVMSANPIGIVVIAVAALIAGLVIAYKRSTTFRNIVNAAFGAVAKTVTTVVGGIKKAWGKVYGFLSAPVKLGIALVKAYVTGVIIVVSTVVNKAKAVWGKIKPAITGPIKDAKRIVDGVWEDIKTGFGIVKDKLGQTADKLETKLTTVFNAIKTPILAVRDAVQAIIDKVVSLINKLKDIKLPDIDIPFAGRVSGRGSTGSTALAASTGGRPIYVGITVPGGFIGDEAALVKRFGKALSAELRRNGVR